MVLKIRLWFKQNYIESIYIITLISCLLLVIFVIRDYGASYDESVMYGYAKVLPHTYFRAFLKQDISDVFFIYDNLVRYYGTSYLILGEFASRFLSNFQSFGLFDRWHILNFSTFLIGAYGLFWLCKKFSSKSAAFIAGLLYITQPLLWGHGVMNPKDTPFAAFFILSVAFGIKMVDTNEGEFPNKSPERAIINFFSKKWYGKIIALISFISVIDRAFNNFVASPLISYFLQQIIKLHDHSVIANWFFSKAQNLEMQPDNYLNKFLHQINFLEFMIIFVVVLLISIVFLRNSTSYQRWVILAGIILGFTISIRTLGPAAGFLILVYWIINKKLEKVIFPYITYILIACFTAYIFWPYLWNNPISNFLESFKVMANFPWKGSVRFDGIDWPAATLPWNYLPKLIGMQLTIPSLILMCLGTIVVMIKIIKHKLNFSLLIPLFWFFIPLFGWMILRPTTYDNFRQFLFIIPPIFILAAIGLDKIVQRIHQRLIKALLCIAIILPGIISGVLQHPYEYIYYNGFVGWTSNIERRYEADYWDTAVCEAGKYLDPLISSSTQIAITNQGKSILLLSCMRKKPIILVEREEISRIDPDFSVISTRWDDDIDYYRWMTPIHTIKIGNTDLLVIKQKQ